MTFPLDRRPARLLALALVAAASISMLAACSGLKRIDTVVRPYRAELVQGNFVSKEQAAALQPGMSREQVRDLLGSPLVTSLFHDHRWDYVFYLRRPGEAAQEFRLTVFFKDGLLERFEGDELPSESEFVARLYPEPPKPAQPPRLRIPEEALPAPRPAASEPAPSAPLPERYPPLEPTS